MKLRIVSGDLGRRYITIEKKAQNFRPTQERVRIAVAEKLQMIIPDATVVDICAGSGAFGFEMISRGATSVTFVENDRNRALSIVKHGELFNVKNRCNVVTLDVKRFVESNRVLFDIVFYDPPYEDIPLAQLAGVLPKLLSPSGVLIYERTIENKMAVDLFPVDLYDVETKKYGDTVVDFVRVK